jgi:methyl-accepting chemotaxis protein
MTLNQKITISFGLLLALGLGSAVLVYLGVWRVNTLQTTALGELVPGANATLELERETNRALAMHRGVMILGDEASRIGRLASWDQIDTTFATLDSLFGTDHGQLSADVDALGELLGRFRTEQDQIMVILGTDTIRSPMLTDPASTMAAREHCAKVVTPLSERVAALNAQIRNRLMEQSDAAAAEASDNTASLQQVALATGGATVLAIIGAMLFVVRAGKLGLIRAASQRAREIASGRLRHEPLTGEGSDEVGRLVRAINEIDSSLRLQLGELASASDELLGAAAEVDTATRDVASGLHEQNEGVDRISAAITQMSASIREVASMSSGAADAAGESSTRAQQGGSVVQQVVDRMHSINKSVSDSASSVSELGRRSEQIGEIIGVINDIADQTNLLALNAAIEAARAGEHGRGFAVVADEVRKLAERTTVATEEVRDSIVAIQKETSDAVERMESGTTLVKEGVTLTTTAGESLEQIVSNAGTVTSRVSSIAAAADEQAGASEEISRGVSRIAEVARDVTEQSNRTAQMGAQVTDQSRRIRAIIDGFEF